MGPLSELCDAHDQDGETWEKLAVNFWHFLALKVSDALTAAVGKVDA